MATDKNINDSTLIKLVDADFADALNRIYASRVSGTEDGYALITELITYIQSTISDIKAKVSATDTTSGYLDDKLTVTSSLLKTIASGGGNETLLFDLAATITGIKTFLSFPITPSSAPTTDYQAANKKYVDDNSEWQILLNKLSNITQTVDYISLFANSVEVARIGDGVDPKIIVDPIGTYGTTTGYWFANGITTGIYSTGSNNITIKVNSAATWRFTDAFLGSLAGHAALKSNTPTSTQTNIRPSSNENTGLGKAGANQLSLIAGGVEQVRCTTTGTYIQVIKSGATQVAAGAGVGEMWKTASHATLPDNVIMHGV